MLGIFFLRYYQYQINPDGISYISIAQKYLEGNFGDAINGYWGPLISWLLVPFLFFGLTPLIGVKILSLIIGFLTIIGVRALSYRFGMSECIRGLILFSLIPIILYFALSVISPDLLLACTLIYYLSIIFNDDYADRTYKGALCGAIGGIAYLSKHYAFPFFISHFLLFNLFHYLKSATKERKKTVLQNLFSGLAIFFLISGCWIGAISNKYNEITIGTSIKYNHAFIGPDVPKRYPILTNLPNETAVTSWEDPSYYPAIKPWNPLESWRSFKYQLKNILLNSRKILAIHESFSFFSPIIITAYILFCISISNKTVLERNALYPLVTIILYSSGYALFIVEERYLWINCILLILMGGHSLHVLFQNDFFNNTRRKLALMLFILSFITAPSFKLVKRINEGKDIYVLSKKLKSHYNIQGNIASNGNRTNSGYLSYHLNTRYHGQTGNNIDDKDLQIELKEHDIDYFLVWDEPEGSKDDIELLSNYKEITGGKIEGLKIYSLKENK